ncbi:MAG: choice-of-anchor Q domain-containing protein [Phycisphaerales bacterium]|nr:choice-of-anchor Q domain-containing protein [Phycisphaerales bacterium]
MTHQDHRAFLPERLEPRYLPATFVVNTTADVVAPGPELSLREAILDANATVAHDTITFSGAGIGTHLLNSALPVINWPLTIDGGPSLSVHIRRNATADFAVLEIAASTLLNEVPVILRGLRITNGRGPDGGGIDNLRGRLTVENSILENNSAVGNPGQGGAISNRFGSLTLRNSVFNSNSASGVGGAVYSSSELTTVIEDSAFTMNTAGVDGGGAYLVARGRVTIGNSAFTSNSAGSLGGGARILLQDGPSQGVSTLTSVSLADNTAATGGGLDYRLVNGPGSLEVDRLEAELNEAINGDAGGAYFGGPASIRRSTLSRNTASRDGGGLVVGAGTVAINDSTIDSNSAGRDGGGIFAASSLNITNSTLSTNTATARGGGIHVSGGTTNAAHLTIAGNSAATGNGRGLHNLATMTLNNSIVANGTISGNMVNTGSLTGSFNINQSASTGVGGLTNTIFGNPNLGPLTNNGGPTRTHAIPAGSIARDAGNPAFASPPGPAFDQRGPGFARLLNARIDIGALEHPDIFAPTVTSIEFLFDGVTLPAPPHRLRFVFSEDVSSSIANTDLVLQNLTSGQTLPPTGIAVVTGPGNQATFTFPGVAFGVLPDGNYNARIPAGAIEDAAGNLLASDAQHSFFVFAGDANRDRSINMDDFSILASRFNLPGTFSQGDFNYDGVCDVGDFTIVASKFNTSLPAPGALPPGLLRRALAPPRSASVVPPHAEGRAPSHASGASELDDWDVIHTEE